LPGARKLFFDQLRNFRFEQLVVSIHVYPEP
jgi:hypothetical protein